MPLENYVWAAGRTHLKRSQSLTLLKQRAKRSFQEAHICPTSDLLFKGNKVYLYLRAKLPMVEFCSGKSYVQKRNALCLNLTSLLYQKVSRFWALKSLPVLSVSPGANRFLSWSDNSLPLHTSPVWKCAPIQQSKYMHIFET